jgi:hypothetical protein
MRITVVAVGQRQPAWAQDAVDDYCTSSGTRSIKAALESNKTLSGYAFSLRVTEARNIGLTIVGETTFLTAEFPVTVYA